MGLISLSPGERVYIDTQFLIYWLENSTSYYELCDVLWSELRATRVAPCVSELSIHECLVRPIRQGDEALIKRYDGAFGDRTINFIPVVREILRRAASIRARYTRIKTPDAIHIATAEWLDCKLIITNDEAWRGATSVKIVLIDSLMSR
jgi:predicted nucleic acid-binding protein